MKDYQEKDEFGKLLRRLIDEKSLSIRGLSRICQIDHATISKIINGKRKATITHLQKFAVCLNVELSTLMKAAGYSVEVKEDKDSDIHAALKDIQRVIASSDGYNGSFTMEKMDEAIVKYKDYSQTDEGKQQILSEFQKKVDKVGGMGPYIKSLKSMYSQFSKESGTIYQLAFIGSALLYFIVTTDLLPDYLFPIGFLDDALVVQTVLQHVDNKR